MVPLIVIIALILQLIFVFPVTLLLKNRFFENMAFLAIYITVVFGVTHYFLQTTDFTPPNLMTSTGPTSDLMSTSRPLSEVNPERYAEILKNWQREYVKKCVTITLSGLTSGILFWRIYSGSFKIFAAK